MQTFMPTGLRGCVSTDMKPEASLLLSKRRAARGPLLSLNVCCACLDWCGKGASGQASALRWSGLRFAPTALRCSVSWPVAELTSLLRNSVQTVAPSQLTKRAARAATSPALLGAPEARSSLPEHAFAEPAWVFVERTKAGAARQVVPDGGDFCGDEKRRPEVGARSALRQPSRRHCLNGVAQQRSEFGDGP